MGFFKKYPLLTLLLLSGGGLTITGLLGRPSLYQETEWSGKEPALYLVMDGIHRGIYPGQVWTLPSLGETAEGISLFLGSVFRNGEEELALLQGKGGSEHHGDGIHAEGWIGQEDEKDTDRGGEGSRGSDSGEESKGKEDSALGEDAKDAVTAESSLEGREPAEDLGKDTGQEKQMPLRSFTAVTEDYFEDAVFIGDSRTVGLYEYGGLEEKADFFAKISLTIYDVQKEAFIKSEGGEMHTVTEMLQQKQYGKVYLMLGINELGTGTVETFMEKYREVVEEIRKLQPEAVIFVRAIMRVTESKHEADSIFNNTNINIRNEEIARLADNREIFYLDVNPIVCDEAGHLNREYTVDDIHLKAKYYELWKDFLLEHGILTDDSQGK